MVADVKLDHAAIVVWCDFGGVLTPPIGAAIASVVEATGIPWRALADAADDVAGNLGLHGLAPLELGLLSQREWGARMTDRLGAGHIPQVPLADFGVYWYCGRSPQSVLLNGLRRLRSGGVSIGLLTNSVREWEPLRHPLLDSMIFDAVVRSHEVGLAKPDPRIFAHADSLLPVVGGASVLVDDLAANCAAAKEHGWRAIHHRDADSTLEELARLIAPR